MIDLCQIELARGMAANCRKDVSFLNASKFSGRARLNFVHFEQLKVRAFAEQRETAFVRAETIGKVAVRLKEYTLMGIVEGHGESLEDFATDQSADIGAGEKAFLCIGRKCDYGSAQKIGTELQA